MRLPGAQDVERTALGAPPMVRAPALTGAGEALEIAGVAVANAAFNQNAKVLAEAERQQRLSDGLAVNRAVLSFNQRANEALTKWPTEADTTQPEAFAGFNDQLTQLTKDVQSVLPASMSPEAKAELGLRLLERQQAFSFEAGRIHTTSLQGAALDSIDQHTNEFVAMAMASPDRFPDILDMAAEDLAMFNGTLGKAQEDAAMAGTGSAIYMAAISGYLGSERVNDAEALLKDPKYAGMLTLDQRTTLTNRIAAFRDAAANMNVVDSLVTEAREAGIAGPGGYVQMVDAAEGTAQNPMSSAVGPGQFIDATWLDVTRGEPETAGMSDAEILAMREDPANKDFALRMVEKYGRQNAAILRDAGIEASSGNVYLAHFLGPNDALDVLQADPQAAVDTLLSDDVIAANAAVLEGKTAGEVVAWAKGKMAGGAATGGSTDPAARLQIGLDYIANAAGATPEQKRDAEAQLLTQYNRDVALKQVETDQLFATAVKMVWDGKADEISVAMRADLEQAGLWDAVGAEIYDQATGAQQSTDWLWINENYLQKTPEEQARVPLAELKAHTDRETYDKIVAARQASEAPFYARTMAQYVDDRLAPLALDPKKNPEDQRALDVFYAEYEAQVSALQEKNGRPATEEDLRNIVDRLTGQIAIRDAGMIFDSTTELAAFELYDTANPKTIGVAEDAGVPVELMPEIVRTLQLYGIPLTLENIAQAYADGRTD